MKKVLLVLVLLAAAAGAFLYFRSPTALATDHGANALKHTHAILSFGPRPVGSKELGEVRGYVTRTLSQNGWVVMEQKFDRYTPEGRKDFVNLVARYKGDDADPWARPVRGILCAHIDSKFMRDQVFLGADDAASACGAILEIADHLATTAPEQARDLELVFFDGEEALGERITPDDGLYGSRFYAATWRGRTPKPEFGLLLDMIGHKDLAIRIPSDSPPHLAEKLFAAAKVEMAGDAFQNAQSPIIDDHVPLNTAGIPTLDMIGDFSRDRWWHTPQDNASNLSAKSLQISIRVTLRMLNELLKTPQKNP